METCFVLVVVVEVRKKKKGTKFKERKESISSEPTQRPSIESYVCSAWVADPLIDPLLLHTFSHKLLSLQNGHIRRAHFSSSMFDF
jgi:hypothetical protein